MPSIFEALGSAASILQAQQTALNITQRNIANANTPGYTRQRVSFTPATPYSAGAVGAPIVSVESFRNRFIDYRICGELQQQGEYGAVFSALEQVEALLSENAGAGLEKALSEFFDGFSALANAPEDMNLRQQVISRAGTLSREFHRLYSQLQAVQMEQDRAVSSTVDQINALTAQLARVNGEGAAMVATGPGNRSLLEDQRQMLLDQLATLVDISYFETESGQITVSTTSGLPLVVGAESQALEVAHSGSGSLQRIRLDGVDVTSRFDSGRLEGLLQVRDEAIPGYLDRLDNLAAALIERVNSQHALGADFNGAAGGNFFVPFTPAVAGSNQGAASAMAVAFTDPKLVAAAAAGSGSGSNANARLLSAIRDEPLADTEGLTPIKYLSRLIYTVGADVRSAKDNLDTQDYLLTQLQNQRDSLSGVSLDEEAVDIIRYQKAYEACARIIKVWDELSEEVLQILGT